ncbi:MAG TPA: DUF2924 domain-containing protein, partial [Alphaproteobacteria bacterium]|nr:DUF2924 domain-containing protein [Alphaproteobacteria bacterium]
QSLEELRKTWARCWGKEPHNKIGRVMLERSLEFKKWKENHGILPDVQIRLDELIKNFRRNPACFDEGQNILKPGTKIVRTFKGKRHDVTVLANGFQYHGKHYTSLSQIASDITGSRWNGWVFFGLKKNNS